MKRILFLATLIGFLGFFGCATGPLKNHALSENGAIVLLDTKTPEDAITSLKQFPQALIDGDRSSGWESTFTKYDLGRANLRQWPWAWIDLYKGKMRRHAVAVIPIRFPEKKFINRVVVYTIDTPSHPASLFGVKDLAVDYLAEEYEIPELREGPSQIKTRDENTVAFWHPVELLSKNKVSQKFPGRIQQNKKGKIVFRFKPVTTQAIRVVIYDTNDSVLAGNRGYGYGTQDRKGIIRLQEIEVYGTEGVSDTTSNLKEKSDEDLSSRKPSTIPEKLDKKRQIRKKSRILQK